LGPRPLFARATQTPLPATELIAKKANLFILFVYRVFNLNFDRGNVYTSSLAFPLRCPAAAARLF
jgi:hypothetical protein